MSQYTKIIDRIGRRFPVIVGPTSSGKTLFSIQLAKEMKGEIISIDSRQIYRGFCIGTAQPYEDEMENISHHLINVLDPEIVITVGNYVKWVNESISNIISRQKNPILIGGSMLYINAILYGIIKDIDTNSDVRKMIQKRIKKVGCIELIEEIRKIDPVYAELLHPNDEKRLSRAMEIIILTEKSPTEIFYQQQESAKHLRKKYYIIGLERERQNLYKQIDDKVDDMMSNGWVEEIKNLLKMGISPDCHAMQSLGYKELIQVINNEISMESALKVIKTRTRRFAKKQITWMKKMDIDEYIYSSG